jgi:hypothetical protein
MKPLQLVLGAVLVLLIGAVLLWYSLGPGKYERPQPLDPTTATSTSPPTAVTSSAPNGTVVPSTTTTTSPQPPTTASGAPNGNGGDALPVPDPGSVRLRLQLPEGAKPWSSMMLFLNSPGPASGSHAVWTRKTEVRDVGEGVYEALFTMLPPGQHEVWIDLVELGTAGRRVLDVSSGETTEIDLGRLRGMVQVAIETTLNGAIAQVRGALAIESLDGVGNAIPRTRLQQFQDRADPMRCLPGRYFLMLDPIGHAPVFRTFVAAAEPITIPVALEAPAKLVVEMTGDAAGPATVWLAFRNSDGAQFDWRPGGGTVREGIVSLGGRAEVDRMPTGRWTVLARPGRSGPFEPLGDVVLEAGKTTTQPFTYRK